MRLARRQQARLDPQLGSGIWDPRAIDQRLSNELSTAVASPARTDMLTAC